MNTLRSYKEVEGNKMGGGIKPGMRSGIDGAIHHFRVSDAITVCPFETKESNNRHFSPPLLSILFSSYRKTLTASV